MNQKDAVFEAIRQLKPREVDTDTPVQLTKQEKAIVQQKLFDGFKKGRIQYNNEPPSDDKLQLYISGLVSNWLRKDRRLNGHTTYRPGRPTTTRVSVEPEHQDIGGGIDAEKLRAIKAALAGTGLDLELVIRPRRDDEEAVASAHE